jgi:hypothetical protein
MSAAPMTAWTIFIRRSATAVILRCEPLRASKDEFDYRSCGLSFEAHRYAVSTSG